MDTAPRNLAIFQNIDTKALINCHIALTSPVRSSLLDFLHVFPHRMHLSSRSVRVMRKGAKDFYRPLGKIFMPCKQTINTATARGELEVKAWEKALFNKRRGPLMDGPTSLIEEIEG